MPQECEPHAGGAGGVQVVRGLKDANLNRLSKTTAKRPKRAMARASSARDGTYHECGSCQAHKPEAAACA